MNMLKRIISAMLLAALLAVPLVSCSSGGDTEDAATDTTSADTAEASDTEPEERQPYLPSEDYNGAKFHILSPTSTTALIYLFTEEENGDELNDAVYRRNLATEEYLGVDISWEAECQIAELAGIVSKTVQAGDDTYQMVLADSMRGNTQMVSEGLLYDIATIDSVDLSRSYWNATLLDALTIYGKVFFVKSAYTLPSVAVATFNKQMVADMGMDNPYDLVRSGKWVLDAFIGMVKDVGSDINGDGVMDINDRYGMTCMMDYPLDCFIYSSGLTITKLNSEGRMELSIYSEKAIELYEKLYSLINESGSTFHWTWGDKDNAAKKVTMHSGRTLFELNRTDNLYTLRDCEVEYGIVPYPKHDENQENFSINDYSRLMCMPITVSDPEMAGKVFEMLGYYTEEYVYPAYYEGLMNNKVVRDDESIDMLGIIFDSVVCDGGMSYFGLNAGGMQSIMYYVSTKLSKGDKDFASFYASVESKAAGEIDSFYDSIK